MDANDDHPSKAIEAISRLGYAAKGVVYLSVGSLAVMAAAGMGGKTTDTRGAMRELAAQPFGQIILIVLAVGLAGHVLWRVTQAWKDPEHKGKDFKGIATRIGFFISGLVYAALAVYAIDLVSTALSSSGGGSSTEDRTAQAMSYPGGQWAVGAVGLIFIGMGLYQARRSYKRSFQKAWDTAAMSQQQLGWACKIASAGLASRAIVFAIIGLFLIIAAVRANPSEAEGLGGALQSLTAQPFGPILLGIVAAGLVCYGLYCFVNARFRHINP